MIWCSRCMFMQIYSNTTFLEVPALAIFTTQHGRSMPLRMRIGHKILMKRSKIGKKWFVCRFLERFCEKSFEQSKITFCNTKHFSSCKVHLLILPFVNNFSAWSQKKNKFCFWRLLCTGKFSRKKNFVKWANR